MKMISQYYSLLHLITWCIGRSLPLVEWWRRAVLIYTVMTSCIGKFQNWISDVWLTCYYFIDRTIDFNNILIRCTKYLQKAGLFLTYPHHWRGSFNIPFIGAMIHIDREQCHLSVVDHGWHCIAWSGLAWVGFIINQVIVFNKNTILNKRMYLYITYFNYVFSF